MSAAPRLLAYTESSAVGGAELVLGFLLGELAPEIEVGLLALDRDVGEEIAAWRPGTTVATVPAPRGPRDRAALAAHRRAIRDFAPDLVHANQTHPWGCAYAEVAALLSPGVRVLAVEHLPKPSAVPRVQLHARRLIARRLDGHVAVGERAARLVEEYVGLPAGSVGTVENGVPAVQPEPLPRIAAATEVIVGSLGRLTPQKGYDALVRALPLLPQVTVVLVGDGPERAALEALAASLGVASRLIVTGWTADARAHLAGFDVFALPSLWEGLPLAILEAMLAGLPVVANDVGSVAEAVRDGTTGFLLEAGDEAALVDRLGRLAGDAELRRRLGAGGLALAQERFTAAAMARRYERLYGELLGRPVGAAAAIA
ncbi:MAG TPA: glycosyltransferase family 4 protein [Conexibacter sp.]|nr:glycosyltransferase family 4 protein [Conexibacter sp.]